MPPGRLAPHEPDAGQTRLASPHLSRHRETEPAVEGEVLLARGLEVGGRLLAVKPLEYDAHEGRADPVSLTIWIGPDRAEVGVQDLRMERLESLEEPERPPCAPPEQPDGRGELPEAFPEGGLAGAGRHPERRPLELLGRPRLTLRQEDGTKLPGEVALEAAGIGALGRKEEASDRIGCEGSGETGCDGDHVALLHGSDGDTVHEAPALGRRLHLTDRSSALPAAGWNARPASFVAALVTDDDTTSLPAFAVTWDYRCPFARNAHEHLLDAIEAGAPFDVTFLAFSLGQAHVEEGETSVWDEPAKDSGLLALMAGVVVRDRFPERFQDVHRALFSLRHDEGGDLRDETSIRGVLETASVDADAVFAEIAKGWPLEVVREEHERGVADHDVFGVPTFIVGNEAVFVRLMTRPGGDGKEARRTIERVVSLVAGVPELNEFKHTSIPR